MGLFLSSLDDFHDLLSRLEEIITQDYRDSLKGMSSTDCEILVKDICENLLRRPVDYKEGSAAFPDIGLSPFGIEVKTTESDSWTSTANSVLESTRRPDVEVIYVVFIKQGGEPGVMIRSYEDVVTGIKVTHSPRYAIDMRADSSLFDEMGTTYNDFRKDNPVAKLKDHFKRALKRMGKSEQQQVHLLDETKDETTSVVITAFSALSGEDRNRLKFEIMALLPEVLSTTGSLYKYEQAAMYLAGKNVACKSLRDLFSAGGQKSITIGGRIIMVPATVKRLSVYAEEIRNAISRLTNTELEDYWEIDDGDIDLTTRLRVYEDLLDNAIGGVDGVPASEFFRKGLEADTG